MCNSCAERDIKNKELLLMIRKLNNELKRERESILHWKSLASQNIPEHKKSQTPNQSSQKAQHVFENRFNSRHMYNVHTVI